METLNLKKKYQTGVVPELLAQFQYRNQLQVPRVVKVIVSRGVGEGASNPKAIETSAAELATITGQKPLITRAKKSIAGFKIRKGDPVGCKITLRGQRMYDFLDKLVHVALPKTRDFKGMDPRSFDGRGNYTFGIREQLIFPEVNYDKVDKVRGMDITLTTSTDRDEEAQALLVLLGFPFQKS